VTVAVDAVVKLGGDVLSHPALPAVAADIARAASGRRLVIVHGGSPQTTALSRRLGLARQWLHARELGFAHPADGRWVTFTSPYPPDLARALELLRE